MNISNKGNLVGQIFNINNIIPLMEEAKVDIISDWIKSEFTTIALIKLDMSKEQFIEEYANNIFDNAIKSFQTEDLITDCPYMQKFVGLLSEKDIGINEAMLICMDLRKVFFEFLYISCGGLTNRYEVYKKLFDEVFLKLNKNLAGLIKNYNKIFNNQKEELKYSKILSEYKKAVDAGSILSKTDKNGIITFANDAFCKISGYTKEELLGKSHNIVRHPDMPSSAFAHMWSTIQSKEVWKGVVKNRAKDGSTYIVNATIVPILDEQDNIVEYIGLRHDITELVMTKEEMTHKAHEIKESVDKAYSMKLESLVKVIPVPAMIIDIENTVVISNEKFSNIFDMFEKADVIAKIEDMTLILDDIFMKEDGCVYHDDIFDFKNTLLEAEALEVNKVKIDTGDGLKYFEINIQELQEIDDFDDFDRKYLITLT